MTGFLLQQGAALLFVLLTAGLVLKLGLGGDRRIRTPEDAATIADSLFCGFTPVDIALDRAGIGALLRDAQGRQLLIRRHGSHFAGRMLGPDTDGRLNQNFLTITTGDAMFGSITLDLGRNAAVWAAGFRRLGRG